jgi:hypothetical protein
MTIIDVIRLMEDGSPRPMTLNPHHVVMFEETKVEKGLPAAALNGNTTVGLSNGVVMVLKTKPAAFHKLMMSAK